ncbi:MAG: NAD(P)-dependent oxidoreductase [Lentisphaerae bacterium]|nr:NAD(P)-dependent oxidoreductase [Lentisphaerota bacterium]
MGTTLVTGASGLIGGALARALAGTRDVVGLSRNPPAADIPWVRGEFHAFEDLRALDRYTIDAVVHLAAVTGGCSERDGIRVNGEGTRGLMRYLIDRGCRKAVVASSIAAVGFQNTAFRPLQLPIPDEHPCLDREAYGLSKYIMEELLKYLVRRHPDVDVQALRLAVVTEDEKPIPRVGVCPLREWALGGMTYLPLSEAVRAFTLALDAPPQPGMRIMNAVSPRAWVDAPVADILRNWYGDGVDVSPYTAPGHERDAVFAWQRIRDAIGFEART